MLAQSERTHNVYQFGVQQDDTIPAEFSTFDARRAPVRNPFNDPLVMAGVEAMRDLVAFVENELMGSCPEALMARRWIALVKRQERAYANDEVSQ